MTASEAMLRRIRRKRAGWVFTPHDFIDLGSPHLVGMVLLRLRRRKQVRRLARGLYDVPRTHPVIGPLLPTADAIAQAIARRDGASIQPSEAMAANLLSLSEQVPARIEYETDGPSRIVRVGKLTIRFRQRPPRKVGGGAGARQRAARMSSLLFAALRNLGRAHVTHARIAHLRVKLSAPDRRALLRDLPLAPAWMHPFLRSIARPPARAPRPRRTAGGTKRTSRRR